VTDFRDIEIIGSTIRNGRIYFSSGDSSFFPADSFGDRSRTGGRGVTVEFVAGGDVIDTDIRDVSTVRISPRRSFASFLKSVRAEEGKMLRITKVSNRKFKLDYLG
jgi:hypothetical protein